MTQQVELQTSQGDDQPRAGRGQGAQDGQANFLNYVKNGHYDSTVFHRVIPGFMVQGGGFEPGMTQKPTDAPVENEANNGLRNEQLHAWRWRARGAPLGHRAVLHQRRRQRVPEPQAETAAGLGLRGLRQGRARQEVVDAIEQVHTGSRGGHDDVPLEDVTITRATVVSSPADVDVLRHCHDSTCRCGAGGLARRSISSPTCTCSREHAAHLRRLAAHMRHTRADAVFILGDLFEVWVGDDMARARLRGAAASRC